MQIKKTTIVETKERGRVIRRTITTVEARVPYTDHDYDWDTMRGAGRMTDCPLRHIMDAYYDYRMSNEW